MPGAHHRDSQQQQEDNHIQQEHEHEHMTEARLHDHSLAHPLTHTLLPVFHTPYDGLDAEGALLRGNEGRGGEELPVYLITNGSRHQLLSSEDPRRCSPRVETVNWETLTRIRLGAPEPETEQSGAGVVAGAVSKGGDKGAGTGGRGVVLSSSSAIVGSSSEWIQNGLCRYKGLDPAVRARDGTDVFIIRDGRRHAVPDWDTFTSLGYDDHMINFVRPEVLESIPLGPPLSEHHSNAV